MSGGGNPVERARACVGVRFRPQGRDPRHGLDCLGLVAVAYGEEDVRGNYTLRGAHLARLEAGLRERGLAPKVTAAAGDIVLFEIGGMQLHLGIFTGSGVVHADAGLRRVVERPGEAEWPVRQVWGRVAPNSLASLAPLHHPSGGPPPLEIEGRI